MIQVTPRLSTGLPGLDHLLRGLLPGDNIVWQVDSMEDYIPFLEPYCQSAQKVGRQLVYFRFARHQPLLARHPGVTIKELDPGEGFEAFISQIHAVLNRADRGTWYLFDCLTELAAAWYSDAMLGNFFMLTCPFLYDVESIAYFNLMRHGHSLDAIRPIMDTAQVFLDVYNHRGRRYLHPVKVQHRHSPTMYMLHGLEDDAFVPVTESAVNAEVLGSTSYLQMDTERHHQGVWNRTFLDAKIMVQSGAAEAGVEDGRAFLRRMIKMAITRDSAMAGLAERYLAVKDILAIGRRIIGTGLIGGKSVGMLLARAVLQGCGPEWDEILEPHDSFYVGSDVFYTFLVQNGLWSRWDKGQSLESMLVGAERVRQRIIVGAFPGQIKDQFESMLDYFGQSPIIVRSSSLLEDNYGHSFAGKYESVFLANQGSREQRLHDFLSAVRHIYASTMSEKAIKYRVQRGMLARDEQMALLVQRVSGALHGSLYYPHLAGVAFSYNPYVWSRDIDPESGVIRLVFGLGTRAVDRADDDYTRVAALNAPERRPEENIDKKRRYVQRKADVLDLQANLLVAQSVEEVARESPDLPLHLFAEPESHPFPNASRKTASDLFLTFDSLFRDTDFVAKMRWMLNALQDAYQYPVDVEFTANFLRNGQLKINIVQCRPLQVKRMGSVAEPPSRIAPENVVLESKGAVLGQSRLCKVDRIIYISPDAYGQLPIRDRYALARLVGKIAHLSVGSKPEIMMLMAPGRVGTLSPELGLPVNFMEINTINILCEIVAMGEHLIPDVSLGTHFFSELVEADLLYFALFPDKEGNCLNKDYFAQARNLVPELVPVGAKWAEVLKVVDPPGDCPVVLNANTLNQRVVCYRDRAPGPSGGVPALAAEQY